MRTIGSTTEILLDFLLDLLLLLLCVRISIVDVDYGCRSQVVLNRCEMKFLDFDGCLYCSQCANVRGNCINTTSIAFIVDDAFVPIFSERKVLVGFIFYNVLATALAPRLREVGSIAFKIEPQVSYVYVRNLCNLAIAIVGKFDGECIKEYLVSNYVLEQQI